MAKKYMAISKDGLREITEAEALELKAKHEAVISYAEKVLSEEISIDDVPSEYKARVERCIQAETNRKINEIIKNQADSQKVLATLQELE